MRGEPSRDFAKVSGQCEQSMRYNQAFCHRITGLLIVSPTPKQLYELDNDPQRKEFLDELFVFMQKRGNMFLPHLSCRVFVELLINTCWPKRPK